MFTAAKVVKKVEQPNKPDEDGEKRMDDEEQYETLHAIMQTLGNSILQHVRDGLTYNGSKITIYTHVHDGAN